MNSNIKKSERELPMVAFVELASGFWVSQAMSVAARLGVGDAIKDEVKSVEEIAETTGTDARYLYKMLRTLASLNVFDEVEHRRFALTPIGQYLRTDNPYSLRDLAIMHGDDWHWRCFGQMYQKLKEGKPATHYLYGVNNYWDYLTQNPEPLSNFNKGMIAVAKNFHTPFIESYDFSSFTKVVDVGGGVGTVISFILKANPHLQGILFDLPETVADAAEFLEEQGVADRCHREGGDMFKSVPAGADLYVMSHLLIDCDDDGCITLLKNIRAAIPENGKVLVIDPIIPPGNGYSWGKWIDLFELTMGCGGCRTQEEFDAIFQKAGFNRVRTLSMDSPCSVMELAPV